MQQLTPNTLLQEGKYKIEKVLGQGGFGITYLAEQVMLGRKVAVKEFFMKELCDRNEDTSHVTLGTEGSRDTVSRFREKFVKEARNIAKLSHPNIVRIIDIFEENGTAYYVMEYAEGGSLADRVKKDGYISEPLAKRYILQVAEALRYIHQQKMNHLDIKPANIMLNNDDNAVLIDFGLSKQYDSSTGNQTSTTPVGISDGYAPLEQYRPGGVGAFSPETDIYSLGATLFKLLTGITPPSASDVNEDGVPVDELKKRGISKNIIDTICKSMEGKKRDRFSSVDSFITSLNSNGVDNEKNSDDEQTIILDTPKVTPAPPVTPKNIEESTKLLDENSNNDDGNKGNRIYVLIAVVGMVILLLGGIIYCSNNSNSSSQSVAQDTSQVVESNEKYNYNPNSSTDETEVSGEQPEEETSASDENYQSLYRITKNVFVREGPGTDYDTKYSPYCDFDSNNTNGVVVYEGTIVEAIDDEVVNGFMHVRQTNDNNDRDSWGDGWVSARYLESY